jgi:hypothetical protein
MPFKPLYDPIIRNDAEYQRISDYIVNKPANWQNDKFYSARISLSTKSIKKYPMFAMSKIIKKTWRVLTPTVCHKNRPDFKPFCT